MVNYNSNDFYFDRTKYRNNTNISTTINKQNYGDDDLTIVDPNEYQFKYYDRFDTYKGLFNTQQLIGAVDFNKFENHCFFESAVIKTETAFNYIYDKFPIDGTKKEVNDFLLNIDGFTKNIYNQFEKNLGYLKFDNSYISVKNESGYLFSFQRNEQITNKLTNHFLNPKNSNFAIDFRTYIEYNPTITNQIIFQYLDKTSSINGFTCWIKNFFTLNNKKYANIIFSLTDSTSNIKNYIYCKFYVEVEKWNHIIISIDKKNKSTKEINVILNDNYVNFINLNNTQNITISDNENYKIESFNINTLLNISNNIDFIIGKGLTHVCSIVTLNYFNLNVINNFAGYLDEFRYFHNSLDKNYSIKYRDNNIYSTDALILYFRFNEPSGNHQNNSIVFDHSGKSFHSKIQLINTPTSTNLYRSIISDLREKNIGNPILKYEEIDLNPSLIPSYQLHIDLNYNILEEAKQYDQNNPNNIFKLFPRHYFFEGAELEGFNEITKLNNSKTYYDENLIDDMENFPGQQKKEAIQTFANLLTIWAKFFDQLKLYLQILPKMIDISYEDINQNSIVNFFIPLMAKLNGYDFKEILNNPINKLLDGYILGKDSNEKSNITLRFLQNEIWKRILINSKDIISSKGTIHSIRSIFNSVGINPDEYYRFREYGKSNELFVDESYLTKNKIIQNLNFYNTNNNDFIDSPLNKFHEYYYKKNVLYINHPNFNFKDYYENGNLNFDNLSIEFLINYNNISFQNKNILIESILKIENITEEYNPVKLELVFIKNNSYSNSGNLYILLRSNETNQIVNFDENDINSFPCIKNISLLDGNYWHISLQFNKFIPNKNTTNQIILTVQRSGNINLINSERQLIINLDINNVNHNNDIFDIESDSLRLSFGSRKSIDIINNTNFRAGSLFPDTIDIENNIFINQFLNSIIDYNDLFENYINFNGNISLVKLWKNIKKFENKEIFEHANNPFSLTSNEMIFAKSNNKKISNYLLLDLTCQDKDAIEFNEVDNIENIKYKNINLIDYSQTINLNNSEYKNIIGYFYLNQNNSENIDDILLNTLVSKSLNIKSFDIKFDEKNETNKVKPAGYFNEDLASKEGVDVSPVFYINQLSKTKSDIRFSIEMSNVKHLNEDIANLLSNIEYFSNVLSDFSQLNESEYIDLEKIQRLYFQRITSNNLNLTPLYEIYQIFDNILTELLNNFIASRVKFNNNVYVIESHALERHKYYYKFNESQNVIKGNIYDDGSKSFIHNVENSIRSINYLNKEGRILREYD